MQQTIKYIKILLDISMLIIISLLMGYQTLSELTHESLGISVFVLFILHQALNYRYYKVIFKGKYDCVRIINLIINIAMIVLFLLILISSSGISRYFFKDLNIIDTLSARTIHLVSTAWLFVTISLHLGLQFNKICGLIRSKLNSVTKIILTILNLVIVGFGVYVFAYRGFYEELFHLVDFKYYADKPFILYIVETLSMVIAISNITYWIRKSILLINKKGAKTNE